MVFLVNNAQVTPQGVTRAERPWRMLRPTQGVASFAAMHQHRGTVRTGRLPTGHSDSVVTLPFAGNCTAPYRFRGSEVSEGSRVTVEMHTPCRRCTNCLKRKRAMWAIRAVAENTQATKTYFVTLTVNDVARHQLLCRAMVKATQYVADDDGVIQGTRDGWPDLSEHEQSWRFFLELGKEVTKYLKRVRKACASTHRLRYFMVYEKGTENGREHVHLLVHADPVAQSPAWDDLWWALVSKWKYSDIVPGIPLGIATADQVRDADRGGWYAAKYLADDSHNRARASLRYGHRGMEVGKPRKGIVSTEKGTHSQ